MPKLNISNATFWSLRSNSVTRQVNWWHFEPFSNIVTLWDAAQPVFYETFGIPWTCAWNTVGLLGFAHSHSNWICLQHQRKKKEMKNLGIEYEVYKSLLVEKVDCSKGLKRCQRFYSYMHSFANFPQVDSQENNNAFNQQGPSKLDRQDSQNGIWIKSKSNSWNSSIINVQF